jgi:hypothetical protein
MTELTVWSPRHHHFYKVRIDQIQRKREISAEARTIISLDSFKGSGNCPEALLAQSHQKEVADRSAKFLYYKSYINENVICSKTTKGMLESLINPNTMEVIHSWTRAFPSRENRWRICISRTPEYLNSNFRGGQGTINVVQFRS